MTIRLYQLMPVLLFLVTPIAIAEQDDGVNDAKPKRCINTGSILRTKIIDDANIVFIMRRNQDLSEYVAQSLHRPEPARPLRLFDTNAVFVRTRENYSH